MILVVTQTLKIVVIGAMAVIVALGGQRFFDYYSGRGAPADIGQRVSFAITDEDTTEGVSKRLHDAGMIKYELYFQMLCTAFEYIKRLGVNFPVCKKFICTRLVLFF